jgi:citrate lyase subunit beta/citryl-CoA lyase
MPRVAPDGACIDLEDGVAPGGKAAARSQALASARALRESHPDQRVYLRVNAHGSTWFEDDVASLDAAFDGVVLPKVERREQLEDLRARLATAGLAELGVVAGIESARGVVDVDRLLDGRLDAVDFGAEDYVGDLGGRRTPRGDEVLYARSRVVLAARLAGIPALDQVVVAFRDDEAFRADARRGRELGYAGKLCIHPRQVELAHEAFTPSPEEVARAERFLAAAEKSARSGSGVASVDGEMVDEPMLRLARRTLGHRP